MPPASRSMDLTQVHEWNEGRLRTFQDHLVGEEPLEIRVGDYSLAVTMRTPGDDLELVAGFLFAEGLIRGRDDLLSLVHAERCKETERGNIVQVRVRGEAALNLERTRRNFFAASSCGICGKASIESVRVRDVPPLSSSLHVTPEVLCAMPETLRSRQEIFGRTGGLHAAGLFDAEGRLVAKREDVGRHNAVDKVLGWALLDGRVPLAQNILIVSGRGGFEIVQKAVVAGVPVVACISAPSGLAVRLARELRLTLVGFLRGERFVIYSGEERLLLAGARDSVTRET